MEELNFKSVDVFISKYNNIPDSQVLRNMNTQDLEAYLLMIYNLRITIINGQSQYKELLKKNKSKKDQKLSIINNEYQNSINKLEKEFSKASEIDSKYKERLSAIKERAFRIHTIIQVVIILLTYLFIKSISQSTIIATVIVIGFAFSIYSIYKTIVPMITGGIEQNRRKEVKIAHDQDIQNINNNKQVHVDKLYKEEAKVYREYHKIEKKIENDFQHIYSNFEREAQKLEAYLPLEFRDLNIISTLYAILNVGYGDNWKEIINFYREQKNMNELKGHMRDIQNTLNSMNNNIMNNQRETIQTINTRSQQQQLLLQEVNTGIQQSNNNIKQINQDMNYAYDNILNNQENIHKEVADMNPHNTYKKY